MTDAGVLCPRCGKNRAPEAFVNAAGRALKSCALCREAAQRVHRRRRERIGAAGIRADNLRVKYGISVEAYDALRAAQGYRCAICGRHEDDIPAVLAGRPRADGSRPAAAFKLSVDHCHGTGRVRGLLCVGCNAAIGHFRDDEATLLSALAYLRAARQVP